MDFKVSEYRTILQKQNCGDIWLHIIYCGLYTVILVPHVLMIQNDREMLENINSTSIAARKDLPYNSSLRLEPIFYQQETLKSINDRIGAVIFSSITFFGTCSIALIIKHVALKHMNSKLLYVSIIMESMNIVFILCFFLFVLIYFFKPPFDEYTGTCLLWIVCFPIVFHKLSQTMRFRQLLRIFKEWNKVHALQQSWVYGNITVENRNQVFRIDKPNEQELCVPIAIPLTLEIFV